MFFPRGGSAQVVRYLARAIAEGPSPWRPRVVSGSLGAPGTAGHAATFFAGLDVVPVPYDAALAAPDPLLPSPPFHPSYEDRPGAPDRAMAGLGDEVYEHLVAEWSRVLAAPGVLDDVAVAHLHHLTRSTRPWAAAARHPGGDAPARHRAADARPGRGRARWAHSEAWTARMRRGRPGRPASSRRRRRPSATRSVSSACPGAPGGGRAQRDRPGHVRRPSRRPRGAPGALAPPPGR